MCLFGGSRGLVPGLVLGVVPVMIPILVLVLVLGLGLIIALLGLLASAIVVLPALLLRESAKQRTLNAKTSAKPKTKSATMRLSCRARRIRAKNGGRKRWDSGCIPNRHSLVMIEIYYLYVRGVCVCPTINQPSKIFCCKSTPISLAMPCICISMSSSIPPPSRRNCLIFVK